MADSRDWVDVTSKLLLPVVLAVGGSLYTIHKDSVDKRDKAAYEKEVTDRQEFERDTGYIRLAASGSEKEREFALQMVGVLVKQKKFPADLVPLVAGLAAGKPSDNATQVAAGLLAGASQQDTSIQQKIATATQGTNTSVYIQIGRENQRTEALLLQEEFRKLGLAAPGIELVSNDTVHTYVRYFAAANKGKADQLSKRLNELGFSSEVQDFSTGRQLPQLEVWIGTSEPVKHSGLSKF